MSIFCRAARIKIIMAGIVVISSAYSLSASAVCTPLNGWRDKNIDFALPITIIVQRDDPIGKVLYTKDVPFAAESWAKCSSSTQMNSGYSNGWTPDVNGLTQTNVPGVSVIISKYHTGGSATPIPSYAPLLTPLTWNWVADGFRIEFKKTGTISGGTLSTGRYAYFAMKNNYYVAYLNVTNGTKIVSTACSVTNTSIPIDMGDVKKTLFSGVGSAAGEKDFSVPLNCDASTKINITLDGTPHSSGIAGVLALDPSATENVAEGVGLQLLFKNTPVNLKTAIAVGTATTNGPYSVPLTARYLQTGGTVKAGAANSTATFTMTYN